MTETIVITAIVGLAAAYLVLRTVKRTASKKAGCGLRGRRRRLRRGVREVSARDEEAPAAVVLRIREKSLRKAFFGQDYGMYRIRGFVPESNALIFAPSSSLLGGRPNPLLKRRR